MKRSPQPPYHVRSIPELHRLLHLPPPLHPLISVIDLSKITCPTGPEPLRFSYDFYSISTKKGFQGSMRYGQTYYDFDAGTMTFIAPGQVLAASSDEESRISGWWISVHPDLIRPYPLGVKINSYGFFSYDANEALHLSEKEDEMLIELAESIGRECENGIDAFTQDIVVNKLEMLLNYCNRYYNRQFITRKTAGGDLITRLEGLLEAHFSPEKDMESGLPTVQELASHLAVSAGYLSDLLRSQTGLNAQQYIQNWIIERSKSLLAGTSLSVSEIAYRLGFSYPQSFNKLFKNKTNQSPLEYRQSLN